MSNCRLLVHEDVAAAEDAVLAEEAGVEVVVAPGTGLAGRRLHPEEPRRHLHVPLLFLLHCQRCRGGDLFHGCFLSFFLLGVGSRRRPGKMVSDACLFLCTLNCLVDGGS